MGAFKKYTQKKQQNVTKLQTWNYIANIQIIFMIFLNTFCVSNTEDIFEHLI